MSTLYIVATPIGNLGDITLRAIETLKRVVVIAAEDTRHSRVLLSHYQITTPVVSLHGDNEQQKAHALIQRLEKGDSLALISDAGTPLISDPGRYLVQVVREAGFAVESIPGPSAVIAALSIAGLSTQQFRFEGFLPHKGKSRRDRLVALEYEACTLVFYESCHRISDFLDLACAVFGTKRRAVVARELTKRYETVTVGQLDAVSEAVCSGVQKGEYVVMIEGAENIPDRNTWDTRHMLSVLCQHVSTKQAASIAAEITGQRKRDLYQEALSLKEE